MPFATLPLYGYNFAHSGHGAAWLARFNGVEEVVGSNPAAPTSSIKNAALLKRGVLLSYWFQVRC